MYRRRHFVSTTRVATRAKVVTSKHNIFLISRKIGIAISLRTKINNEGFLQKTHRYSRAQSGKFWWLGNCGSQSSQWRKWITKNHRHAVVLQDLATLWLKSYPCKTKTSQETQKSLMKFLEPRRKPEVIYTDCSMEFGKSCEELTWNHSTSTPHRTETHRIAERAVRRIKEGTSAVLLQSGLGNEWWARSMECCCYLRNIQDLLSDGKTPHERRFGVPFNGPVIPFGAMVENHPTPAKDISILHQFGPKVLPSTFLGYALHAVNLERRYYDRRHWRIGGDGRIWNLREKTQCKRGDTS